MQVTSSNIISTAINQTTAQPANQNNSQPTGVAIVALNALAISTAATGANALSSGSTTAAAANSVSATAATTTAVGATAATAADSMQAVSETNQKSANAKTPEQAAPQANILDIIIPAPKNLDAAATKDLTTIIRRMYLTAFTSKKTEPEGDMFLTYHLDLSSKNINFPNSKAQPSKLTFLKMTSYTKDGRSCCLKLTFDFNGQQETYFTPRIEQLPDHALFNGMELERIFHQVPVLASKKFWAKWEQAIPQEGQHYDEVIYPEIIKRIEKISATFKKTFSNVLDLGGGSGRLSALILKKVASVQKVIVADRSAELLAEAQKKGKSLAGKLVTQQIDLEKEDPSKKFGTTKFDLIVLCGVVAQQVLSHQAAKATMANCLKLLNNNGFVIAASLSPAILNSADYEAMGFKVLNRTFTFYLDRGPTIPPTTTNDFYILQKK